MSISSDSVEKGRGSKERYKILFDSEAREDKKFVVARKIAKE